uniref:Uncharacterized protein n=1 Tax=Anguilla anguilla TaxID=7936 RepID=A0A0E9V5P7_ANGAN
MSVASRNTANMQFSVEDTNRSGSHTIAQRWGYISKPIIQNLCRSQFKILPKIFQIYKGIQFRSSSVPIL